MGTNWRGWSAGGGQMLFLESLGAMRSPGLVLNANMVYLLQPAAINRPCNYTHVLEERICRNSLSKERPETQPRSRCAALDPPSPHFQRVSIEYVVRECHKTVCVCVCVVCLRAPRASFMLSGGGLVDSARSASRLLAWLLRRDRKQR